MQTSGNASHSAVIMIANGDSSFTLGPGAGSITGVLGPEYYFYTGTGLDRPLSLSTAAGDSAGHPATGRVGLWATLSLSSSPLLPVPEPGSWALILAGLARRRR